MQYPEERFVAAFQEKLKLPFDGVQPEVAPEELPLEELPPLEPLLDELLEDPPPELEPLPAAPQVGCMAP